MPEPQPIPSEADWKEYWLTLDENWAHDSYFGLNLDSAAQKIASKGSPADDFYYMPETPFQYYIQAYLKVLDTEAEIFNRLDDHDLSILADGLFSAIEWRLRNCPSDTLQSIALIMPKLREIASNQDNFGLGEEIFGSIQERLNVIELLICDLI